MDVRPQKCFLVKKKKKNFGQIKSVQVHWWGRKPDFGRASLSSALMYKTQYLIW